MEIKLHTLLTSGPDIEEWLTSRSGRFKCK